MKREYSVACTTGCLHVAFRETITERVEFLYVHKKQTGDAGGVRACDRTHRANGARWRIGHKHCIQEHRDGNYIVAVEKRFFGVLERGTLAGNPISRVHMVLRDSTFYAADSLELAFCISAIVAFHEAYLKTKPVILKPNMTIEVAAPIGF